MKALSGQFGKKKDQIGTTMTVKKKKAFQNMSTKSQRQSQAPILIKKDIFGLNFSKARNAVFNEAPKQGYNKVEDKKNKVIWSMAREGEQAN